MHGAELEPYWPRETAATSVPCNPQTSPGLERLGGVVFLSCPLVKKNADLSGSFLYSQSTMKDMYSKPTNRTELSIPMKTKSLASPLYIFTNRRTFGKGNNQNVPEQLDLESSFTFKIYSDYACLR